MNILQAISRRIHFGKFIAEAKFAENPEKYIEMIKAMNVEGIMASLTVKEVEQKVLARVTLKASTYGRG